MGGLIGIQILYLTIDRATQISPCLTGLVWIKPDF